MTRKFIWAMVWVGSAAGITWPEEKADPTVHILVDFNNDGKLDFAVNGPDEGVILVYLGDGKGGFLLLQSNRRSSTLRWLRSRRFERR